MATTNNTDFIVEGTNDTVWVRLPIPAEDVIELCNTMGAHAPRVFKTNDTHCDTMPSCLNVDVKNLAYVMNELFANSENGRHARRLGHVANFIAAEAKRKYHIDTIKFDHNTDTSCPGRDRATSYRATIARDCIVKSMQYYHKTSSTSGAAYSVRHRLHAKAQKMIQDALNTLATNDDKYSDASTQLLCDIAEMNGNELDEYMANSVDACIIAVAIESVLEPR